MGATTVSAIATTILMGTAMIGAMVKKTSFENNLKKTFAIECADKQLLAGKRENVELSNAATEDAFAVWKDARYDGKDEFFVTPSGVKHKFSKENSDSIKNERALKAADDRLTIDCGCK
jgi:hypothetical protein